MKILFLTEFFPTSEDVVITGGCESRTYYLAKSLVKKNHEVTIVTSCPFDVKRQEDWGGVKIVRVGQPYNYTQGGPILRRLTFFILSIKKILDIDIDIIDANNVSVYLSAFIASRIKNTKLVYWVPDLLSIQSWRKASGFFFAPFIKIIEYICMNLPVNQIIALSDTTRLKIIRHGCDSKKIKVIYPGV